VTLPAALYPNDSTGSRSSASSASALATLPGVQKVGGVLTLHLGDDMWTMTIQREGVDNGKADDGKDPHVAFNAVTPGYFDAVGMRLLGAATSPRPTRPTRRTWPS
jgi:hypothetical protein